MFWKLNQGEQDKKAAVDNKHEVTYGELQRYSDIFNSIIGKKSLILLVGRNDVGAFVGYTCFTDLNHTVIMMKAEEQTAGNKNIIEIYQPEFVWAPVELDLDLSTSLFDCFGYRLYRTEYEKHLLFEDLAVLLSTSGSTGNVKYTKLTYSGIQVHTEALSESIGFTSDDRSISTMPMAFVYGLSFIHISLYSHATVLLTDRTLMEKEFWDFFSYYKATCISGLAVHYELLSIMKLFEKNCSHLRIMTQGGDLFPEKLRDKVINYCRQYGKACYILYGQTETSGTCSCLSLLENKKNNCIGKPIKSSSFRIENGELVYYGKCALIGYSTSWKDLGQSGTQGIGLRTGDLMEVDSDGYYYLAGRIKRIIKLSGIRISLDDIEQLLRKTWNGLDCAVTGKDDLLSVYITAVSKEQPDEIRGFLAEELKVSARMINVINISCIPRNNSGKIMYSQLKDI